MFMLLVATKRQSAYYQYMARMSIRLKIRSNAVEVLILLARSIPPVLFAIMD
jgi:hypothetical protein